MWIRILDKLEDNGIDAKLANSYKTKIIAQAKIKFSLLHSIIEFSLYPLTKRASLSIFLRLALVYDKRYSNTYREKTYLELFQNHLEVIRNQTYY
jgi:hypothetical protein